MGKALQEERSAHRVHILDKTRCPDAMGKSRGSIAHRYMRTVLGW